MTNDLFSKTQNDIVELTSFSGWNSGNIQLLIAD